MHNSDVERLLDDCWTELTHVKSLVDGLGLGSSVVPYLSKYAVIRACGSIETSFKTVIADFGAKRSKKQVKRFLDRKVRDGSANPSFDMLCKFLHDFDEDWKREFKIHVDLEANKANLLTSLQSLVDSRNEFAHGGSPNVSISDVLIYFSHGRRLIEIMDTVIG